MCVPWGNRQHPPLKTWSCLSHTTRESLWDLRERTSAPTPPQGHAPGCAPHPQQLPVTADEDAHVVPAVPPLCQRQVAAVPGKGYSCQLEGKVLGSRSSGFHVSRRERRQRSEEGTQHTDPESAAECGHTSQGPHTLDQASDVQRTCETHSVP